MYSKIKLNEGQGGRDIGTDVINGSDYEIVKIAFGEENDLQPVATNNPLPVTGTLTIDESTLATNAKQDDQTSVLEAIAALISAGIDVTIQNGSITISGSVSVSNFPATQAVNAAALPLPSGASTSALQTTGNTSLSTIAGKDFATQTTLAALLAKIISAPSTEAKQEAANALLTTIAAITQPLTDTQLRASAVPVYNASLPLPTGASTEATLALIKAKTDNLDVLLSTRLKPADTLAAVTSITNPVAVTGTFFQATQPVSGTFFQATQPVSIAAIVTTSEAAATSLGHNVTNVTTPGTRVQLATNTCKSVTVKAKLGNAGTIYVGGSTVSSSNGFELGAGESVSLDISNTNLIYIDSSVSGTDGITFIFIN